MIAKQPGKATGNIWIFKTNQMRRAITIISLALLAAACFGPKEMQVKVAPMGEVVPETTSQHLYALPQTVLKVEVTCHELRHFPGPFREYAEKYLGITEVIRQNFSLWKILDVNVTPHSELDPSMVYHVNVLKGEFAPSLLQPYMERGIIFDGNELIMEGIRGATLSGQLTGEEVRYEDLGIESNFEERTETMYKTIVTDTSFVEVPVDRTITEQKSLAMKAREAADLLLELRTRRFELLTGDVETFPQGVAMEAALAKLDELEASYLSLFTGKTTGRIESRAWFVVPEAGPEPSVYRLGMFSGQLGFVPDDLKEGTPVELTIGPLGMTRDLGAYYSGRKDQAGLNELFYRLPDVAELKVRVGEEELITKRISLYQSGAVVTTPL
jgi:hypothetical protein